jgi:hypothetical protein
VGQQLSAKPWQREWAEQRGSKSLQQNKLMASTVGQQSPDKLEQAGVAEHCLSRACSGELVGNLLLAGDVAGAVGADGWVGRGSTGLMVADGALGDDGTGGVGEGTGAGVDMGRAMTGAAVTGEVVGTGRAMTGEDVLLAAGTDATGDEVPTGLGAEGDGAMGAAGEATGDEVTGAAGALTGTGAAGASVVWLLEGADTGVVTGDRVEVFVGDGATGDDVWLEATGEAVSLAASAASRISRSIERNEMDFILDVSVVEDIVRHCQSNLRTCSG